MQGSQLPLFHFVGCYYEVAALTDTSALICHFRGLIAFKIGK